MTQAFLGSFFSYLISTVFVEIYFYYVARSHGQVFSSPEQYKQLRQSQSQGAMLTTFLGLAGLYAWLSDDFSMFVAAIAGGVIAIVLKSFFLGMLIEAILGDR